MRIKMRKYGKIDNYSLDKLEKDIKKYNRIQKLQIIIFCAIILLIGVSVYLIHCGYKTIGMITLIFAFLLYILFGFLDKIII